MLIVIVALFLSQLRTFKWLAVTSVLGDVAVGVGIIGTVIAGLVQNHSNDQPLLDWTAVPAFEGSTFFKFVGNTSFLFAIHIVILPIMQSLRDQKDHKKVVYTSYTFITVLNALFGGVCVLIFGPSTGGIVLGNLAKSPVLDIIRVLLCIDLLFTIPMVLAAGREIIERAVVRRMITKRRKWGRLLVRSVLVVLVLVLFYLIPDFSDLVTLVGGLVNCLMGFVLPPLIYCRLMRRAGKLSWWHWPVYGAIIAFGVAAMGLSTYLTIQSMFE